MYTYALLCSFTLLFIIVFFTHSALSVEICHPSSCTKSGPEVRFPFRLTGRQLDHCGCPGFDLSCNNQSQTILTLPGPAQFTVTRIDYVSHYIYINDLDSCLPKKILNFSLSGSPYRGPFSRVYTFLNCSSSEWSKYVMVDQTFRFPCLSDDNYTVLAMSSYGFSQNRVPVSCRNMSTVSVPQMSLYTHWPSMNFSDDLLLMWVAPGYESDTGPKIASPRQDDDLPRSAKYGIIIGIGIPGLVCVIGLICYIGNKIRDYGRRRHHMNTELSAITILPQPVIMSGLDRPTIASFPKTVVGESRLLPESNDGTCPICLSEYQPKETLRSIPECNHYFHAGCIDEWLGLNGTCPLCRNSPYGWTFTSCSSILSLSSDASSL